MMRQGAPVSDVIEIRDYRPFLDREHFARLNEEWLKKYFIIESEDEKVFSDPENYIIAKGGNIFIAWEGESAVGTCALVKQSEKEYELAKMAVTESAQGKGIGRLLLRAAIDKARLKGAARLVLSTNSKLKPAIALYQSVGFSFCPLPEKEKKYQRTDTAMEMSL